MEACGAVIVFVYAVVLWCKARKVCDRGKPSSVGIRKKHGVCMLACEQITALVEAEHLCGISSRVVGRRGRKD
jgi:hypothetical protein